MTAAEDVERQVAVAIIVAMEKAALLMPMDRVIGRVEVQNDLARGLCPEGIEEEVDEHGLDRGSVMPDLVIAPAAASTGACSSRLSVLLPASDAGVASSGLNRPSRAPSTGHGAGRRGRQVLVPERQAEDALPHQAPHPMSDEGGMTPIAKARGEPVNQPDGPIRHAEKKSPGV